MLASVLALAAVVAGSFVWVRSVFFPPRGPFAFDPGKPFSLELTTSRIPNHLNRGDMREILTISESGKVDWSWYRGVSATYMEPSLKDFKPEAHSAMFQLSADQEKAIALIIQKHRATGIENRFVSDGSDILEIFTCAIRQDRSESLAIRFDTIFGDEIVKILKEARPRENLKTAETVNLFLEKWAPIQAEIDEAFLVDWERRQSEEFWSRAKQRVAKLFSP